MSEIWSETRDANTLVGSGPVQFGSVRVRLVEFGQYSGEFYSSVIFLDDFQMRTKMSGLRARELHLWSKISDFYFYDNFCNFISALFIVRQ